MDWPADTPFQTPMEAICGGITAPSSNAGESPADRGFARSWSFAHAKCDVSPRERPRCLFAGEKTLFAGHSGTTTLKVSVRPRSRRPTWSESSGKVGAGRGIPVNYSRHGSAVTAGRPAGDGIPDSRPSSPLKKAIVAIFNVGHATTSCRRASQTSDLAIACLSETSCFA